MGALYLVRHGQASFGAADYDQLSPLGEHQCLRLGQWFAEHGLSFDAVLTGTLRRHAQSLAAIEAGLQARHTRVALPGLDEYDGDAVVRAFHPGPLPAADSAEQRREHFRLLRRGLQQWMDGATQPLGMPSYAAFGAGVAAALALVRQQHAQGTTLVVSSGGPICVAIGQVLGLGTAATIELNLQLRNSAVCELRIGARGLTLVSFNTLPHLASAADATSVSHA